MKKRTRRQFAVLGLGIFGSSVAKTLSEYGCEVIALDSDDKCVARLADTVSSAITCDITEISQLRMSGVADCDVAFVCTGNHLEQSVMAIINLKELGVPKIIAKAKNKRYMQIYKELGAHKVYRPEKEMGEQVAKSVLGKNIIELIDLDAEYSIIEIPCPSEWENKTMKELGLRQKYQINIIGIRQISISENAGLSFDPDYRLKKDDQLLIITKADTISNIPFLDE